MIFIEGICFARLNFTNFTFLAKQNLATSLTILNAGALHTAHDIRLAIQVDGCLSIYPRFGLSDWGLMVAASRRLWLLVVVLVGVVVMVRVWRLVLRAADQLVDLLAATRRQPVNVDSTWIIELLSCTLWYEFIDSTISVNVLEWLFLVDVFVGLRWHTLVALVEVSVLGSSCTLAYVCHHCTLSSRSSHFYAIHLCFSLLGFKE